MPKSEIKMTAIPQEKWSNNAIPNVPLLTYTLILVVTNLTQTTDAALEFGRDDYLSQEDMKYEHKVEQNLSNSHVRLQTPYHSIVTHV